MILETLLDRCVDFELEAGGVEIVDSLFVRRPKALRVGFLVGP